MTNVNWQLGADSFIDAVASSSATPGGGAAAAVTAATGCGLCMMAVSVSIMIKSTPEENKKPLKACLDELYLLKDILKAGAQADADAYEDVVRARRLPKESKERAVMLEEAIQKAALVPAESARKAIEALQKAEAIESKVAPVIMSDIICGKMLLKAAIGCFAQNVKANLPYIKTEAFKNKLQENINFLSKFC